jgi:hypothetical protein
MMTMLSSMIRSLKQSPTSWIKWPTAGRETKKKWHAIDLKEMKTQYEKDRGQDQKVQCAMRDDIIMTIQGKQGGAQRHPNLKNTETMMVVDEDLGQKV